MSTVLRDFDHDEVRGPNASQAFMDGKILVREERKRSIVSLLEYLDFVETVPSTDADHLNLPGKVGIIFNQMVELLQPWSYRLAGGSVKAEDLNDNDFSLDLGYFERAFTGKSEIIFFPWTFWNRKVDGR